MGFNLSNGAPAGARTVDTITDGEAARVLSYLEASARWNPEVSDALEDVHGRDGTDSPRGYLAVLAERHPELLPVVLP